MQEISFSIPLAGVIQINEDKITITVNKAETIIHLEPEIQTGKRISLQKGQTMFDLVLETARSVIEEKNENRFSAAELYHKVLERYPWLKRNSWTSHVIACTPSHPSYKHYTSKRNYFSYIGDGLYRLSVHFNQEDISN